MKTISLTFGALAPSIHEQLHHAGFYLPVYSVLKPYQKMADAITLCAIHGVLTEAATRQARRRLMKKIAKSARPLDKPSARGAQEQDA